MEEEIYKLKNFTIKDGFSIKSRNSSIIDWISNGNVDAILLGIIKDPNGSKSYFGKLANKQDTYIYWEKDDIISKFSILQ